MAERVEVKRILLGNWQAVAIFAIFVITFVTFNILFDASSQAGYFKEILAALIGTILAAVVTTMLLKSQTRGQELKEQNVQVFRSKLRVYDEFISRAVDGLNDERLQIEEVRRLKKLVYQISLISSDETVVAVTGFIRSHFVSKDETARMPDVVNAFRLDLALKGVEALDFGDLDVIETALRDPTAFSTDTADVRLAALRVALEKASKGRYDISDLESDVFNSPEGRGFQLLFEGGGALNLDAGFSADPNAPIHACLLLDELSASRQTKISKVALATGFIASDPEAGAGPEANVVLKTRNSPKRPSGTLSVQELSDAVAKLSKI